jgi:HK97 family phage portal protein
VKHPNQWQSFAGWLELMVSSALLHGNGLSVIETDGAGRPTALVPVNWQDVSPILLSSGALAFDIMPSQTTFGTTGAPRRVMADATFHLRDRGDGPFIGRSRISRAPEVLANALALQEFSSAQWRNQATPCGALELETSLNKEGFERLRHQLDQTYSGASNARKVMILDNKAKWRALSVSPEDAEILSSRRFSVEEICRLYGVPGPLVNDLTHGTFTNSETTGRWFGQFTLAPWCKKIEAEFSRTVFGSASVDRALELDMSGLMRGSFSERWAANIAAVQAGILDANEVRQMEGWNARKGETP